MFLLELVVTWKSYLLFFSIVIASITPYGFMVGYAAFGLVLLTEYPIVYSILLKYVKD